MTGCLTVKIDFKQPTFSKTTINGIQYDRVMIDGLENIGNPGEPVLPVKTLKIFIPLDKAVGKFEIEDVEKIQLPGTYHIEPGQEEAPISNSGTATTIQCDQAIYGSTEPFPKQVRKLINNKYYINQKFISLIYIP